MVGAFASRLHTIVATGAIGCAGKSTVIGLGASPDRGRLVAALTRGGSDQV